MAIICAVVATVVAIVIWCVSVTGRCVHLRIVGAAVASAAADAIVLIEMTANPMRIIIIVATARMDAAIRLMVHTAGVVVVCRRHYRGHSAAIVHISIVMMMVMMMER